MTYDNEEYPGTYHHVHATGYGAVSVRTGLFHAETYASAEGKLENFGVTIHRDGQELALSAGSILDEGSDRVHTYHSLSIEDAREIADELNAAADAAEMAKNSHPEQPADDTSFLRRLLE